MHRRGNTWIGLAYLFSFWLFAPFIDRTGLFHIVYGLAAAAGLGLAVAWLPAVLEVIKDRWTKWTSGHYLVSGVWLFVTALVVFLAGRVYYRATGDRSVIDALWSAWAIWGVTGGLLLCMTANGVVDGRIPPRNWILAGRWVALGVVIAVLLHATGIVDAL